MAPEQDEPAPPANLCATCLGAGKVIRSILVNGTTRQVWSTCPFCNAPQRIVTGP